jgi:hypothetical protein
MNGSTTQRRSAGVAWTALVSLWIAAGPANAIDDNATIEAVWMPRVVDFAYHADGTFYTCSSLWQKVEGFLLNVGARAGATLQNLHCNDFSATMRLQIALEAPVEATPENLRALTDYDAEDLLVARVRGQPLATAADVKRFPAVWQTISLRNTRMQLTAGDCELVRQMRRQLLPKLSVQVLKEAARCSPVLARGGPPNMKVRALLAAR